MTTHKLSCYLEEADFQRLRKASMTGRFSWEFEAVRHDNGCDITIYTTHRGRACSDLENVIDFGATSAREVFDVPAHM